MSKLNIGERMLDLLCEFMSGTVKKLFVSFVIAALSPLLNTATCGRMYSRNASLSHRPCNMILSGSTFCKYRNIAKLERIE